MLLKIVGVVALFVLSLQANYILLGEEGSLEQQYKQLVQKDKTLQQISKEEKLTLKTIDVAGKKLVSVGEFGDAKKMALFYMHITPALHF